MRFVALPRSIALSTYMESLDRMVALLKTDVNVLSIYQVGSVGSPGISDIDLWVVFRDGADSLYNPRADLDADGRYLFSHDLFGICQSDFMESQKLRFFHNFSLLYGEELRLRLDEDDDIDSSLMLVEKQAALEYLLNAYHVCTIEQAFGVVNVRNLLLYAKALLLDLEPLGIDDNDFGFREVLDQLLELRENWFESRAPSRRVSVLHPSYRKAMGRCLREFFQQNYFWYPFGDEIVLPGSIKISNGADFGNDVSGIRFPSLLLASSKRVFNLQRRFMRFNFRLPMTSEAPNCQSKARFDLICRTLAYNSSHLPHFIPLPFGLNIFRTPKGERK